MTDEQIQNRIEIMTGHELDAPDTMPAGSMLQIDLGNIHICSYPSLWDREYYLYL